jgi:hypothetical protein
VHGKFLGILYIVSQDPSDSKFRQLHAMIGENRQLVPDELVEFEKHPVDVQDCRKITDHFRGIYRIHPNPIKENRRMSTCNRLDLQTLGSQPTMSKNLPDHWLHVDIFWCCFHSFEIYSSIYSFQIIGNYPEFSNFNWLFPNSTGSSVTNRRFSPDIDQ